MSSYRAAVLQCLLSPGSGSRAGRTGTTRCRRCSQSRAINNYEDIYYLHAYCISRLDISTDHHSPGHGGTAQVIWEEGSGDGIFIPVTWRRVTTVTNRHNGHGGGDAPRPARQVLTSAKSYTLLIMVEQRHPSYHSRLVAFVTDTLFALEPVLQTNIWFIRCGTSAGGRWGSSCWPWKRYR